MQLFREGRRGSRGVAALCTKTPGNMIIGAEFWAPKRCSQLIDIRNRVMGKTLNLRL